MENKPSLPANIDSEVLKLNNDMGAIANAYKMLADTVQSQNEKIEELTKELADLKDTPPETKD